MLAIGYEAFVYTAYTINARGQFDAIVSESLIDKYKIWFDYRWRLILILKYHVWIKNLWIINI